MNSFATVVRKLLVVLACAGACAPFRTPAAQPAGTLLLVAKQGRVEVLPPGTARTNWVACETNQLLQAQWRLRTRENSRATLQWPDLSVVSYGEMAELEVLSPSSATGSGLRLIKGILSFLHKDEPGDIRIITRGANAGIKGTEFVIAVEDINGVERTTLSVIDGVVSLTNEFGALVLTNGEQAVVDLGQAPVLKTAGILANNLLQWAFYYPAVLDLRDLPLAPAEQQALAGSLVAYRSGDLLAALENYPAGRQPATDAERVYQAALFLSVGQVQKTEAALAALPGGDPTATLQRLATALRQLIAAVKRQPNPATTPPQLPTELLAASYYEQSRAVGEDSLRKALALTRQAAMASPEFSFAWARVAELEFSFGRTGAAAEALAKSLALAERNAQALALQGFLHAARNRTRQAAEWFDRAIAVDPALGNAWLGRGLVRIRRGDARGGRADLMVAAALEPQRASLRSYLGKALAQAGDTPRALHELELAKRLDPADPTPWLYSALLNEQNNRINEGIRDLERSVELNDNRRLYRSRDRLDEDRAVRSANLARLYADAGLTDVGLREAGRGIGADYANYSAHLFLANSYETQRRASLSNLRFEAPAISEYLVASLLGPASGRILAQPIAQLDYAGLLERDGLGLYASTEYFSRGAWHHSSAQYGTFGSTSYSLEADYITDPAERFNQDLEIRQFEAKLKHDITPANSMLFRVVDFRANGGDTLQQFDASQVAPRYRFEEEQSPSLFLGYHHQWSPQSRTLLLAGRFDDHLDAFNPSSAVIALDHTGGTLNGLAPVEVGLTYRSQVELYSVEAQHISVMNNHSLIGGTRFQWSSQTVASHVADPNGMFLILLGTNNPISVQHLDSSSFTAAAYVYDYWRLTPEWQLIGGLNFTHQNNPMNTGTAPVSSRRETTGRLSPKAGVVWNPATNTSVRAVYSRSLTSASLGESARLEPTHVAGLLQTYRDPIPLSLAGGADAVDVETAEVVWEMRFTDTYLAIGGQHLRAHKDRRRGLYLSNVTDYDLPPSLGLIRERLDFREEALHFSVHQLLGREWSFGLNYRLAYARLDHGFPDYPAQGVGGLSDDTRWQGWLHTLNLSGLYRHSSGLFARAEGVFFYQDRSWQGRFFPGQPPPSSGDPRLAPGDQFWQVNVFAGFRFPRQRGEASVGMLNAIGGDYRLDPLNQHPDLPRSRTFSARLLLNF